MRAVMLGNGTTIEWDNRAVEEVKEKKDRYRDSEDLEGMQDILESVILKTSHLPLEFIQNAEDEESSIVGFHLYDSALLIYNDGYPFRIEGKRNDIKGFCSIGVSQKYKKGIGFLGVGAKTAFTISKKPWVVSGKYNFIVENMLYPSPRQEFPPSSFNPFREVFGFPQKGALFYLPLLPDADGKRDASVINKILGNLDQSVIMFLDSVETVEVRDLRNTGDVLTFTRSNIEFYVEDDLGRLDAYTCKKIRISSEKIDDSQNKEATTSDWIIGNFNISISKDAKNDLPLSKLYDKKRASSMTRVSIAIPLSKGEKKLYPLYCYLPVIESSTGLPFILQGDFIPEADRNHIRSELLWNREILKRLGVLLAKVVQTCSENSEINIKFSDLIPWEQNISHFLDPFVKSFKRQLLKTKFKLEDSPSSIELRQYIVCNPDTSFLAQKDLRPVHLHNHFRLFLGLESRLRKCLEWIGVRTMIAQDLFNILLDKSKHKLVDNVWIFDCYYSLAKGNEKDGIDEQTFELIRNRPWLFTNRRTFSKPHERMYFRMPKAIYVYLV